MPKAGPFGAPILGRVVATLEADALLERRAPQARSELWGLREMLESLRAAGLTSGRGQVRLQQGLTADPDNAKPWGNPRTRVGTDASGAGGITPNFRTLQPTVV